MRFGSGKYTYEYVPNWGKLPAGWSFGWIPAVACDSHDNVYIYSRSEHPLVIFDREGNFLDTWGEGVLQDAHGIYIDAEDNVFCTERNTLSSLRSSREVVSTARLPSKSLRDDRE